ncbi:hypothetical protein ABIE59_002609 [Marinobacter sp. MBR-99]|jgi:hypothetical protein|uniref:hypothetical protein n=1 Tax=Marinobacter sp. MBR-99 TaxID=3156461 RepID=UPI0033945E15
MKLSSVDSQDSISFDVGISGYWDDDQYVKEIRVSASLTSLPVSGSIRFLGYLQSGSGDEVVEFLSQIEALLEKREGKAELSLKGLEEETVEERSLKLSFFPLDSLGHLAVEAQLTGSTRYSDKKQLEFGSRVAFEIEPTSVEAVFRDIKSAYGDAGKFA